MKRLNKILVLPFLILYSLTSCTNNFEEINTNPNKLLVGDINAYNCFEPLLYGLGRNSQHYTYYWNNELIQMTAFTSGATRQEHMYQITGGNWQTVWDAYARYGYDAHHMIDLAQKQDDKYYEAVGLILKAYSLSNLVSLFGDIPFKEAYQLNANVTPAFDPQEEVVDSLIANLDRAGKILNDSPEPIMGGFDSMYGDNTDKWRKFANSLRMRMLCRMSGVDAKYWAEIQKMVDNPADYPVFTSNADNATITFTGVDPYVSYYGYEDLVDSDIEARRLTEQMIKMMVIFDADGNSLYTDPRLAYWGKMRGKKWKGTIAGCTEAQKSAADEGAAAPNAKVLNRPDMDAFLMDYSEILFIYAEGVQKGKLNMPETAKTYYEQAVTANMQKWNKYSEYIPKAISPNEIKQYFDSDLGSYDKAATDASMYKSKEEFLLSQKWLSLFWVLFEPYHEWRRTEYPILTIGDGTAANQYELPTRFGYPNYTESSNRAHVNEALERMGGANDMHTPLIWSYKKLNNGASRNPHPNAAK